MIVTDKPTTLNQNAPLVQLIKQEITENNNQIPFDHYMQLALYAPQHGYYNNNQVKFGQSGDFITAPEIGNKFAYCLAQQVAQLLEQLPNHNIFEFGAGSGKLAADLLLHLEKENITIDNYYILEVSASLQQRQQDLIKQYCPHLYNKITWLQSLPSSIVGIIIANEVLDAMPTKIFHYYQQQLQEYYVTWSNNQLALKLSTPTQSLSNAFKSINNYLPDLTTPYVSEINLLHGPWTKTLNHHLQHGAILLFDYGFGRKEYYHPQRNTGTLLGHYEHKIISNPLINPGMQDLTAHVDFTTIAECTKNSGLELGGYTNLTSFLINCGIVNTAATTPKDIQEIMLLTSPAEMGEIFKVMLLTKGMNVGTRYLGFELDKCHCL